MYYEDKYLFRFESSNGKTREIRVLHREAGDRAILEASDDKLLTEHTGLFLVVRTYSDTQRAQGRAPVIKKQQNGPIHGTSLTFFAECLIDGEFMEFYTTDPKEFRVDVYDGATLVWQGFITPELYSEPDIAPPYDVQVVATDGIGELKFYDFVPQGTVTLRAMLSYLLGYTGLSTDVNLVSSLKAGGRTAAAGQLLENSINLDYLEGKTCYDALTYLLDTLHATITHWGDSWLIVRETNVTVVDGKVRCYDPQGSLVSLEDSVQALGKMRANPVWPVGQLSTVISPAKNKVVVQAPWHTVTALQNPEMTSDASWTKANGASYATDGYEFPQGSSSTPAEISQTLSMQGIRVPMSLTMKASGVSSLITLFPNFTVVATLTYTVNNTDYYLTKDESGRLIWSDSAPGSYDFGWNLTTYDTTRIEAEDLRLENIPAFSVAGSSLRVGTLKVTIIGSAVKVFGASLDVVLPKGYQDILRLDNGARGEGSTVEVAFGRADGGTVYYAAFLQGLLLNAGAPVTLFQDANFDDSSMNFLAFIARDYALSVALPRAKVTGKVYLEDSIQMPPLVFVKGALNYWLLTWSWDLYEDELEIEAITLPSAQLTVLSETILESGDTKM